MTTRSKCWPRSTSSSAGVCSNETRLVSPVNMAPGSSAMSMPTISASGMASLRRRQSTPSPAPISSTRRKSPSREMPVASSVRSTNQPR